MSESESDIVKPVWLRRTTAVFYFLAVGALVRVYFGVGVIDAILLSLFFSAWGWLLGQRVGWVHKVTLNVTAILLIGMSLGMVLAGLAIVLLFTQADAGGSADPAASGAASMVLGSALLLLAGIAVLAPFYFGSEASWHGQQRESPSTRLPRRYDSAH